MSAAKELEDLLDLSVERVKRNVKVVTPEEVGQDHFLHISTDTNIRNFVPVIGRRQAPMEDRTIPRLCVSPNLLGCFIGYGNSEYDFLELESSGKEEQNFYKGGWKIYAIPFEAALKPNAKLVADSRNSDEHWMVAYSKDTASFQPETAGRCFYRSITYVARSGKNQAGEGSLYLEIVKESGIQFSKNIFLKKGYWVIDGPLIRNVFSWVDDKQFRAKEISKGEYQAAKNESAALLSHVDKIPRYQNWE